jgi:hypothetical protein
VSVCVALCPPSPGVVVTYFVTGSRATSSSERSLLGRSAPDTWHDMLPQRMSSVPLLDRRPGPATAGQLPVRFHHRPVLGPCSSTPGGRLRQWADRRV